MKIIYASVMLLLSLTPSYAADMGNPDFNNAYELYQSMTPEQKAAVKKQAIAYQKKLQAMPPEQREQLIQQAADVAATIDIEKVDPDKLNTAKTPSFEKNQKNLTEYEKKYEAGKIKNAVVKPKE